MNGRCKAWQKHCNIVYYHVLYALLDFGIAMHVYL